MILYRGRDIATNECIFESGCLCMSSDVVSTVGSMVTTSMGWVGTVSNTVTGNPLLLLGVVLPFIGFAVGLFRRMLNV